MVANPRLEKWHLLHQRLRGIATRRAALDAEEAQCLREADAMQLWRRLGYIHMGEYLERELGYGPHAGGERLRVARELGRLPRIEAGLAAGTLSHSAVRELTRIATADTEAAWLDAVRGKTLRQIEGMVAGRKQGDRPEDPTSPELIRRVVRLELSPQVFALFRQVQAAMADEHGGRLDDSALIEALCRRALESGAGMERPAYQIATITVCESCERGWQGGAGHEIEVGPEVIGRARCDAEVIGSLDDAQPARVTATVTPRLRRQVLARDRHRCAVPGCRSARNLDLHHIEYQRDGGRHEMENLLTVCSGHHQLLHEGALTITGKAPDTLGFAWPGRDRVEAGGTERAAQNALVTSEGGAASGMSTVAEQGAAPAVLMAAEGGAAPAVRPTTDGCEATERTREARAMLVTGGGDAARLEREVQQALTDAGYKRSEARAAVARARSHVGATATLAQWIREALRCCTVR